MSEQLEERLRRAAQTERMLGHYELEQMLLDAADTIWQLRDDLQRANAATQDAEHDESMAWDRVRKAEAEADRLRELVRDAWGSGHPDKSCGDCEIRDECHDDMERLSRDGVLGFSRCLFELRTEQRMRELGIEVEDA